MWNLLLWIMEAAALVAIALSDGGGCVPKWGDFVGIILLLLTDLAIGFYEEECRKRSQHSYGLACFQGEMFGCLEGN